MDLHFNKHHQTYITNLNNALTSQAEATSSCNLLKLLELQPAIKFNAGDHINHALFWEVLAPKSSLNTDPSSSAPNLHQRITQRWGSVVACRSIFKARAGRGLSRHQTGF